MYKNLEKLTYIICILAITYQKLSEFLIFLNKFLSEITFHLFKDQLSQKFKTPMS